MVMDIEEIRERILRMQLEKHEQDESPDYEEKLLQDETIALPGGGQYRPKYPDSPFIHIADLVNRGTGKTYREENAERQHVIPIGALVGLDDGVRLFVVHHGRDCDQTPLYYLSHDPEDTRQERQGWKNNSWIGGFSEESLAIVDNQDTPCP